MTSDMPKKPSEGSSHVFIGLAAVMLLATGGLIFWKVTSSPSEPVEATPSAPSVAVEEERPRFAPPPPPPPEETPSAAPSAELPSNATLRSAKSPCAAVCNGEASAALRTALAGRAGAGRRCYEKALSQNATLSGKMTVHLKIAPNGQVCAASIANDSLQDPGLNNCILGVFRASQFPAPQGGCVEADVPLNFVQSK